MAGIASSRSAEPDIIVANTDRPSRSHDPFAATNRAGRELFSRPPIVPGKGAGVAIRLNRAIGPADLRRGTGIRSTDHLIVS
jgi:hypothetical protein